MAEIFISYSRADCQVAAYLAARLEAEGWSVFWDPHVMPGEAWREVIEREAGAAGCIVVLWSDTSVKSRWVREEAGIGVERAVLVPALISHAKLPFGFSEIQTCDLSSWDGEAETAELADLLQSITALIGGRKSLTIRPAEMAIVVGRPQRWGDIGATINIACDLTNSLDRVVRLCWLDASATGPRQRSYYFVWKLLFDEARGGGEHVRRIDRTAQIEVRPGTSRVGIQFQAPTLSDEVEWPSGEYVFQLWGWADRKREGERANLRTEFTVQVPETAAAHLKRFLTADDATWQQLKPSDDAIGIPVLIADVRAGLAAH